MRIASIVLFLYGLIQVTGQSNAAEVAVVPSTQEITPGEIFFMNVSIDPRGTAIAGAQLNIIFNSSSIIVNSITEGDLFGQSGANTYFNSGSINNSTGIVSDIFNAIIGRKNVSSQGTLIIINMMAVGSSGTSSINLSNVKISDLNGNPVALNVSNGSILINSIVSNENNNGNNKNGGSSGGGGGGGGISGENFSNIETREKHDGFINKNSTTSFIFTNTYPIIYVNITGNISAGEVNVAVEVLRNTSSLVKGPAPDNIYKNINIWVGTSGFAAPSNIKHAEITFRVPRIWIDTNSIDPGSITMMHYLGAWGSLPTKKISETSEWIYYEASTTRFSPHAITGKRSHGAGNNLIPQMTPVVGSELTEQVSTGGKEAGSHDDLSKYLIIGILVGIILSAALIYKIRKPDTYQ